MNSFKAHVKSKYAYEDLSEVLSKHLTLRTINSNNHYIWVETRKS